MKGETLDVYFSLTDDGSDDSLIDDLGKRHTAPRAFGMSTRFVNVPQATGRLDHNPRVMAEHDDTGFKRPFAVGHRARGKQTGGS